MPDLKLIVSSATSTTVTVAYGNHTPIPDPAFPIEAMINEAGVTPLVSATITHNAAENTIVFTNLVPATSYDISVSFLNTSEQSVSAILTISTITPTLTIGTPRWENPLVKIPYTINISLPNGPTILMINETVNASTLIQASDHMTATADTLSLTDLNNVTSFTARVGFTDPESDQVFFSDIFVIDLTAPPAGDVTCFFGNAPVLTPTGYRRIDSLREGDMVSTPGGKAVPIERVKVMRCAATPSTNPYIIPAGQFGATKKLLISPRHRVATATGMVEARDLGLAQEKRLGELVYYNLGLPSWTNMVVAGVEVESLAPVTRITVPLAVFKIMIAKRYGAMTPALAQKIAHTCRFVGNNMVECPAIKQ